MILRRYRLLGASTLLTSLFGVSLAASPGSSAAPVIHTVAVGSNGYSYNPNITFANPGDIVVFQFFPTNHSVIRAEYTNSPACGAGGCNPCVPYELNNPGEAGFSSGNVITQNTNAATAKTWNLTINDTQPIFFYCNALNSCHPNGMVGVINPNSSVSLENQHQAAVAAPYQLAPGEPFPAEGSPTPTSAPSSPAASPSSSPSGTHLSGGAIAGIVIGAIAVLLLAAALFYFVGRSKTYRDILGGKGSSAPGGLGSQVGDLGPWSPAGAMSPRPPDARFSTVTTAYSQVHGPTQGRFIGYNRQTGAPEFAADGHENLQPGTDLVGGFSPQLRGSGFAPPNEHLSAELPGDAPAVAEISGSNGKAKRNGGVQ